MNKEQWGEWERNSAEVHRQVNRECGMFWWGVLGGFILTVLLFAISGCDRVVSPVEPEPQSIEWTVRGFPTDMAGIIVLGFGAQVEADSLWYELHDESGLLDSGSGYEVVVAYVAVLEQGPYDVWCIAWTNSVRDTIRRTR